RRRDGRGRHSGSPITYWGRSTPDTQCCTFPLLFVADVRWFDKLSFLNSLGNHVPVLPILAEEARSGPLFRGLRNTSSPVSIGVLTYVKQEYSANSGDIQ